MSQATRGGGFVCGVGYVVAGASCRALGVYISGKHVLRGANTHGIDRNGCPQTKVGAVVVYVLWAPTQGANEMTTRLQHGPSTGVPKIA